MSGIITYTNVFNTALVVLHRHGFELVYDVNEKDRYIAMLDNLKLQRKSPVELLGLVTVYWELKPESLEREWWRIDGPDYFNELSGGKAKYDKYINIEDIPLFNTCLSLIKKNGFEIKYIGDGIRDWDADKGKYGFSGYNPLDLLGLLAIYWEIKPTEDKEYWWKLNEPDIITEMWKVLKKKDDNE